MFYHFVQNNSGGKFLLDHNAGIGRHVVIEAESPKEANKRAKKIGLYFHGVRKGKDCEGCGDRWDRADKWNEREFPHVCGIGAEEFETFYSFNVEPFICVHPLDKPFYVVKKTK